ncbi:NmrA family NAD(P)-binding protein [Actinomycetospora endophytica]|uniref:NmrA family NAD(P)-binding protein n=1 Tax=Actinomycetospora endophytica TaxID=2291215 RepID=A0ABS8PAR8_9PSEU|nr:NmrA family NAD(P)-binding protein [Actinomycetospora endophytica]MCD2195357.1 NmrA family NAD(P)-binding protein [Actinomycetospora endophytica]
MTSDRTVLVVGATGTFGTHVVPELHRRGVTVRALARSQDRAEVARRAGADEVAIGDLTDAASLRAAVYGADGVFHLNPVFVPDEAAMGVRVVEAARDAGATTFVFSSVYHPSMSLTNHAGKRPVEEALFASGLRFTVLQPAIFFQTLDGLWASARDHGRIGLPFLTTARQAFVDYRDVAEVAARAFVEDTFADGTFELAAPGTRTRVEIAGLMAAVLGREVTAEAPEFGSWADAVGLVAGPERDGMRRMFEEYDRHGFPGGNALVLRAALGREPRALDAYIAELAGPAGQRSA